ncbi:FMN-binding protein [Streptomyces bungoensis]|uniref:FMN-binding protein n=1 Tax=Streptomyces bungoensis TaxID=285568 RepID=A0A101T322_9ACTN|nr:FMN-binding protein [Streptomyces bungoensis]KUN84857.1 FMN-binding protein [Streptomyces bungoensis]
MRKSHPVRRVVLATAATVSGVVLLLSLKPASDPAAASAAGAAPPATAGAQQAPQGGQQGGAAAGSGTVTGNTVQTQYGAVQVRLTVSGGKITKAEAVQAPKGGVSSQKTALAVPKLNQEAVAAGNANIDAVSGATYTSTGYKQSLQSALDKAKSLPSGSAGTGSAGSGSSGSSGSTSSGSGSAGSGSSGTSGSAGSGQAQTRTVTGKTVQTQYGPVQVRITVSNGKITKADAVQAPAGGLSSQKTALAVPKLNQEAVAAGNAHIDAVSGATYTSTGYKQSLQSALDQAGG